jgi:hypothetical protein
MYGLEKPALNLKGSVIQFFSLIYLLCYFIPKSPNSFFLLMRQTSIPFDALIKPFIHNFFRFQEFNPRKALEGHLGEATCHAVFTFFYLCSFLPLPVLTGLTEKRRGGCE